MSVRSGGLHHHLKMSGVRVLLLWVLLLSEVQLILAVRCTAGDDINVALVVFIPGGVEKEENLGDVIFTKDLRLLSPRARRHFRGTKKDKKKSIF